MERLTGTESVFLDLDNNAMPLHVSSLAIYDPSSAAAGKVGFKDILRFFNERGHRTKVFRHRLVTVPLGLGRPYWIEDPDFDVEFHLRHIALPKPGDWRQLCIQVARLHARPLDRNRPLWEAYVIEGLDKIPGLPKGSFALMIKTHYAAISGQPGPQLLAATHELSPESQASPPKGPTYFERLPSLVELLSLTLSHTAGWPLRLLHFLTAYFTPLVNFTTTQTLRIAKLALRLGRSNGHAGMFAPATRFNGKVTPHRVVEGVEFDIGSIERMRDKAPGATVNDVAVTIIAGALRRYLQHHKSLPARSLSAEVPITSRSEMKVGSSHSIVDTSIMPIHTDIAGPVERLHAVVESMRRHKGDFQEFLGKKLLLDAADFVPNLITSLVGSVASRLRLGGAIPPLFNTSISSIRGPDVPLYMAGARMVGYYGLSAVHDLAGLGHVVCYYDGSLTLSVTACRKMLPDPAFYAQCLQEAYTELGRALEVLAGPEPMHRVIEPDAAVETAIKPKARPRRSATTAGSGGRRPKKDSAAHLPQEAQPEAVSAG